MFVDSKMYDHHCVPLGEVEQVWEGEFHTKHRSDAFDPLQKTVTYFYVVQITFFLLGSPDDLVFVSSSCSNNFPKRKGWISFATCLSIFTLFQLRWTNQFVWLVRTPRACLPNGVERLQPWSVNLGEKKDWTLSNTTLRWSLLLSSVWKEHTSSRTDMPMRPPRSFPSVIWRRRVSLPSRRLIWQPRYPNWTKITFVSEHLKFTLRRHY